MIKSSILILVIFAFVFHTSKAQSDLDSTLVVEEFFNLEEALKNPESVYRLDLSNQSLQIPDNIWVNFPNLTYLSLKNDHLKELPVGIESLTNLKVLDLSGNDFKVLPTAFSNLTNLEELFLNDDKYFQLKKNILTLSKLPNLKSLHLENDGLKVLPKKISMLINLESLYLNNNRFKNLPQELMNLENLKYLDFHDNRLNLPDQETQSKNFGLKIDF
jgi:Leucine-rich repeat (LRR) protein